MRGTLALFALVAATVSCRGIIEAPGGKIPSEYVPAMQAYTGTYAGQFNNVPGRLLVTVEGSEPHASFVSQDGRTDLLPHCESQIGPLRALYGDSNNKIDAVEFLFDPGKCANKIEGRKLRFTPDRQSARPALFAQITLSEIHCRQSGESGRLCDPPFPSYLDGYFTKSN